MRKLILKDGTEHENSDCGISDGVLWCYLKDGTAFHEAITEFDNPAKTGKITFCYGEMQDEYEGYTQITAAIHQKDGTVAVALVKPDNA